MCYSVRVGGASLTHYKEVNYLTTQCYEDLSKLPSTQPKISSIEMSGLYLHKKSIVL